MKSFWHELGLTLITCLVLFAFLLGVACIGLPMYHLEQHRLRRRGAIA